MNRILLVDDHAVVRKGLKYILESNKAAEVEEAESGEQALGRLRNQQWDAVILDIGLSGKNGVEVLKRIKAELPRLPVLMLSMYPEEQYGLRVLKAGASGYLTKASAPEQLVEAIERIMSGRRYISPELAEKLVGELTGDSENQAHSTLSDREYQVFLMIASGMTASVIASQLSLSVKTVHTYRSRILAKLNMKNNAELMHYAFRNKLLGQS